ncbi:PQQ-dependent sugar dehydrogenase [Aquabacterium sp.]|uniref:PQQ-dependent sugar dehydrogenase n=1 Tax=Aquabacterium sp. TaxID=1872578 RepID=UPI004037B75B
MANRYSTRSEACAGSHPSWLARIWLALWCLVLSACGGSGGGTAGNPAGNPSSTSVKTVLIAQGLSSPWGMVFMPDGRLLVTEKAGTMRLVSMNGQVSGAITGLLPVANAGQGGLLDVQLDPDYPTSPWIYWSYAEPGLNAEAGLAGTAVARGRLTELIMGNIQVIFHQSPKVAGTGHFGSRLAFARDKTLFITLGERMQDDPANPGVNNAQNLAKHLGKIVRINRDGGIPGDNPVFGGGLALPGIWSLGHRNVQGATIHPVTGELWASEHGPQGGDEINLVRAGRNYGWPLRSYGCPYGAAPGEACRVGGGVHAPGFEEPLSYWVPTSTAPSGMAFNTGARYPGWEGNLFVGSLAGQALWRLSVDNEHVLAREALLSNVIGRIRDVVLGPDGWLYVMTDGDNARIYRIER